MISQLDLQIHDSVGRESIRYTHGVRIIEYDASHRKLMVQLEQDYVCEDKSKLQTFNVSCVPYEHVFYDVEWISIN